MINSAQVATIGFDLAPALPATRDLQADAQAVRAWADARPGSETTAKSYCCEPGRFLLFLEQRQLTLGRCNADICLACITLPQNVSPSWTSKRTAPHR